LLRGLGSSLTRAISKAASAAQSEKSDDGDETRPAPKLEDDPFPNGEPADSKPADKPNETKPEE
jgi:hypothetical protein